MVRKTPSHTTSHLTLRLLRRICRMWLLSTDRAELRFFPTSESVPAPGYAILSHVWSKDIKDEQTFQGTKALSVRCTNTGENPRDLASTKIREFCTLASSHGYQWAWVDTCCIDKSSSSELSEAINSMFRYYALSDVCYAYLPDVPYQCCAGRPTVADDFRRLCRLLLVSTVGRVACRLSHTPATFPRLGTRNVIGQFLAKQRSSSALVNLCRTHNPYIM